MGHKGNAKDIGLMTGSESGTFGAGGDVPKSEGAIIRGGDESGSVVG